VIDDRDQEVFPPWKAPVFEKFIHDVQQHDQDHDSQLSSSSSSTKIIIIIIIIIIMTNTVV